MTVSNNFVYLWEARHHHFIGRLGAIVARERAIGSPPKGKNEEGLLQTCQSCLMARAGIRPGP